MFSENLIKYILSLKNCNTICKKMEIKTTKKKEFNVFQVRYLFVFCPEFVNRHVSNYKCASWSMIFVHANAPEWRILFPGMLEMIWSIGFFPIQVAFLIWLHMIAFLIWLTQVSQCCCLWLSWLFCSTSILLLTVPSLVFLSIQFSC